MTQSPSNSGKTYTTYLPADLSTKVDQALSKFKAKGINSSQLIAEAIREGLPTVIKRFRNTKATMTITAAVEAILPTLTDGITRATVIDALKKDHKDLI